jgi:hypothetical protein
MAQIHAIDDGVSRAVEEGKPVYMGLGSLASISGIVSPMTISGLDVLRYTVRLCIQRGARPILPVPINPEVQPLIEGIYREVCVAEGKPEAYDTNNVMYFGNSQRAYTLGIIGSIARTGCSLYIAVGGLSGDGDVSNSTNARIGGAITVMATARYAHQGTIAMLADYPGWMDDVYALGAQASGDEIVKSSVMAGDVVKAIIMALAVATVFIALAGQPILTWLNM